MTNTQSFLDDVRDNVKTFIISEGSHLGVGTGTTPETSADTSLETPVLRKSRQEYTEGVSDVILSLFLGGSEANGNDLTEVGVFDAASGGNMMMRRTFPLITKTSSVDIWIDIEENVSVTQ